jgi:adenosylhomocysteine nucleosidase
MERLEECVPIAVGPWRGYEGRIGPHRVIALATGIGMVNAAAALATLIAERRPKVVLGFGCAGAHRVDILPGDVIIGTEVVAYGSVITLPDGAEQYAGFRYSDGGDSEFIAESIRPDPHLLELAIDSANGWTPEPWPWALPEVRLPLVHLGVIASADRWTQSTVRISQLHSIHESLCEEMEAAALAQVSAIHRIPFLAVKDISNNDQLRSTAHGPGGPTLADVETEVGGRSFALVERIIQRMPPSLPSNVDRG